MNEIRCTPRYPKMVYPEAASREKLLTFDEAIRIMCVYCRDEAHMLKEQMYKYNLHDEGDVNPRAEHIEEQYIPNSGHWGRGWIHRDIYGGVYECMAGNLHYAKEAK